MRRTIVEFKSSFHVGTSMAETCSNKSTFIGQLPDIIRFPLDIAFMLVSAAHEPEIKCEKRGTVAQASMDGHGGSILDFRSHSKIFQFAVVSVVIGMPRLFSSDYIPYLSFQSQSLFN